MSRLSVHTPPLSQQLLVSRDQATEVWAEHLSISGRLCLSLSLSLSSYSGQRSGLSRRRRRRTFVPENRGSAVAAAVLVGACFFPDAAPLLRHPTQPPAERWRRARSFVFPRTEGGRLVSVVYDPARRYLLIVRGPSAEWLPPPVAGWREITHTLSRQASRPGRVRPALGAEIGTWPESLWLTLGGRRSVVVIVGSRPKVSEIVTAPLPLAANPNP